MRPLPGYSSDWHTKFYSVSPGRMWMRMLDAKWQSWWMTWHAWINRQGQKKDHTVHSGPAKSENAFQVWKQSFFVEISSHTEMTKQQENRSSVPSSSPWSPKLCFITVYGWQSVSQSISLVQTGVGLSWNSLSNFSIHKNISEFCWAISWIIISSASLIKRFPQLHHLTCFYCTKPGTPHTSLCKQICVLISCQDRGI